MLAFVVKRLVQALVTVFGVFTAVFVLARLTGDPVAMLVSDGATPEDIAQIRASYGFDRPILEQYGSFLGGAVRGDFGQSIYESRPAFDVITEKIPATLELAIPAFLIGMLIAFGLALLVRWTGSRKLGRFLLWVTLTREAVPAFWFGLLLILVFSVQLGWLPALGRGGLENLVLPVVALSTVQIAVYLRLLDAALSDQYTSDHIRTARAAGISRGVILLRHALPNAVVPVITLAGLNFAVLLSGTVVTESVFGWPGVGRAMVDAVDNSDFAVIQAGVVIVSVVFVAVNLLVDLISGLIDPRTRVSHG